MKLASESSSIFSGSDGEVEVEPLSSIRCNSGRRRNWVMRCADIRDSDMVSMAY